MDISLVGVAGGFQTGLPAANWMGGAVGIGVRLIRRAGPSGTAGSIVLESRNDILADRFRPMLGIRIHGEFQAISPFFVSRMGVGFHYHQDVNTPVEPTMTIGGGVVVPWDSVVSLRFESSGILFPRYSMNIGGQDYPGIHVEISVGLMIRPAAAGGAGM